MDTIVEGPPDDGAQDLNLMTTADWNSPQEIATNNSTLLYIAVEYVKGEYNQEPHAELVPQADSFSAFNQHVSPLDPNMSSVARYSPVYSEPAPSYNPVVIHQLVTSNAPSTTNESFVSNLNVASSLDSVPTVLCNGDITSTTNQYLEIKGEPSIANAIQPTSNVQIVPENEQEVKLFITDQATGMSYTVSTQELLVEPCLEEQQLLDALAPDPLLDTDLLALDVNTLKTELSEDIINNAIVNSNPIIVDNYISNVASNSKADDLFKLEPRRRQQNKIDAEEQLLSRVYNIIDRPVPSRAKATLPESHLLINKVGEEFAVLAKRTIVKQTQFGPLEGVLVNKEFQLALPNKLDYFLEGTDGVVLKLDVSDETTSNWMSFVRKAENYAEQNLVLSQREGSLFFTTTKTIFPKEELKVGYSVLYAEYFNLPHLQAPPTLQWPCFECSKRFETTEELQKHLNLHDEEDNYQSSNNKKSQKYKRKPLKVKQRDGSQCKLCSTLFIQPQISVLRNHLLECHKVKEDVDLLVQENYNTFTNYKCQNCDKSFNSEVLSKLHALQHELSNGAVLDDVSSSPPFLFSQDSDDSSEEQISHMCPACQEKFHNKRQLIFHVLRHAAEESKIIQNESFKCPICYKHFPLRDRLQRHMMVHGSEESKPLQCKTCKKRFLNNSALTCHLKTHYDGKKIFECPICQMGFDHVLKLKKHVPSHCENNQYTCPHCRKVFKKYSIVRKHIRAFHCERKHSCEHCQKSFPTLDKLRMHLLKHSDHREFLCADCGKQFKRKDKLKEHCKRIHSEERENNVPKSPKADAVVSKKFTPKVEPTDFHRFIYKCHACLVGFKRRGMLVNHLAKRHPEISPDTVPELNLPILRTTRDYYCQYCEKVYKSSSKRKAHILKNHPGAALPMSNRRQGGGGAPGAPGAPDTAALPNPTFSQTVGSVTTRPQSCQWCHKQYASKAKLLQHQRKKHAGELAEKGGAGGGDGGPAEGAHGGASDVNVISRQEEEHADDLSADLDEDNCLHGQYKITDEDILNTGIEEFNDEDLLPLSSSGDSFQQQNTNVDTSDSHLYRLLTTSNGLPPT